MQDALGLDHEDRAGIFEANGSLFREYAPFAEALPIKRLKLAGTGMCEADGIALLHLIALQRGTVEHLDLSRHLYFPADCILALTHHTPHLTYLKITADFVDTAACKVAGLLRSLPTLQHLDMTSSDIAPEELNEGVHVFSELQSLSHLVLQGIDSLRISHCAALVLALPTSMRHLQLVWHPCGRSDSSAMLPQLGLSHADVLATSVTRLAQLTHFEFAHFMPQESEALTTLFKSLASLPQLAVLNASSNTPQSDSCRGLEHLSSLSHLSLSLDRCPSAPHLARVRQAMV